MQRLLAFVGAATLVVASCREVTVSAADVYRVEIDPSAANVEVGRSIRFQATVRDGAGNELERSVVWASSAPTVLQVSSTGEALGVVAGNAKVTASVEGHNASADVTVKPRPVVAVDIVPPDATMLVDDTVAFQAIARDSDGAVLSGRVPVWISGNPSVVSLSVDGQAIGLLPGVTTVIADVEGVRGQANVSVRARVVLAVAAVTIVPSTATLAEGDSLDLAAVVTAADGTVLTGRTVIWSSDAPGTVSVTADGRVHAVAGACPASGGGRCAATITATVEGVSGSATLTIIASVASVIGAAASVVAGSCPIGVPSCGATISATAEEQSGMATLVVQKAVSTVAASLVAADGARIENRVASTQWGFTQGVSITVSPTSGPTTLATTVAAGSFSITEASIPGIRNRDPRCRPGMRNSGRCRTMRS